MRLFDGSVGWIQNAASSASFVPAGLRSGVCAVGVTVTVPGGNGTLAEGRRPNPAGPPDGMATAPANGPAVVAPTITASDIDITATRRVRMVPPNDPAAHRTAAPCKRGTAGHG